MREKNQHLLHFFRLLLGFRLSPFLFRHGLRRATFPPGEGIVRPIRKLPDKPQFVRFVKPE
jgi:hypothetical protein